MLSARRKLFIVVMRYPVEVGEAADRAAAQI